MILEDVFQVMPRELLIVQGWSHHGALSEALPTGGRLPFNGSSQHHHQNHLVDSLCYVYIIINTLPI